MRRFFVLPPDLNSKSVELKGDEFHHLKNVSRLEVGERAELLDGQGKLALAEIKSISKKSAILEILEVKLLPPLPTPLIKLCVCIPKFQTMDLIIQKAAELGVNEIAPMISARSFLKSNGPVLVEKRERWEKISLEACKQSGRAWPMKVSSAQELSDCIDAAQPERSLFLFEGDANQTIKAELTKLNSPPATSIDEITVFIGAEGGFSPAEVDKFRTKGLKPVTLGDLVLRVETACIAIISVIKYHFDLMR